jgi:outer membrane protein TolC
MREQVAAKEAASYRQQYEAAKDETVRQVKTAYYSLAFIDLAVDINGEERRLLDHYETLAESRYRQGAGLQQAVVKLQAEITRVQSRLEELRSRRVDAEASLNTLMNRPAETPVAGIKLPPVPAVDIDYKQLYQAGRRNRPEVLASLLEIERDEKRIELARKDYWPSFSVGGTFVNVLARPVAPGAMVPDSNGMNVWSVNFGISLPLHRGKYDAEVAEATEAKLASTHGYQETVNAVESSIREVGFRIGTLREQMTLFNTTLVPQTQQSLQSAEGAYSTGSLGVLDLLDSERVLLDVRLGLAQLITDYMKSLADMERAIGSPFPEVKP